MAGAGVAAGAAGVAAWGARYPLSQMYGPTVRYTGRAGTMALTFDDGPNPACTPRLLDLLEKYGVRATFFMIGNYVRRDAGLAREVAARGHVVGNHTTTHPSLMWLGPKRIEEELRRCEEALDEALGTLPAGAGQAGRWMRPPYGSRGPQLNGVVRRMGFAGVVMWSQIFQDWVPQAAERLIGKLGRVRWDLEAGRGGDVMVLHDGWSRGWNADREWVLKAMEYWLPRWREKGVEFVEIKEARK